MFELLEVRLAVETHTAELAARNATRSDIAMMEMALDAMRRNLTDASEFNQADLRFHSTVAAASKNRLLSLLIEGMEDPLRRSRIQSIQGYQIREPDFSELIEQHEKIFEAIAENDPDSAGVHMQAHLKQTRKDLHISLSAKSDSEEDMTS